MKRRRLLPLLGAGIFLPLETTPARAISTSMTLLNAPLELGGTWDASAPPDAATVIEHMRTACLTGVALLSDHQPEKLRVDDHTEGPPFVWLHTDNPTTGWIVVDVRTRDWCNLAYQFGHELGHVFCNSWAPDAKPRNPCQWVEEALVEAFSLRGLGLLADGWEKSPPFPHDAAYASSIRSYRANLVAKYQKAAQDQGIATGFAAWFTAHAAFFAEHGGVDAASGAVSTMLGLLEDDAEAVADMGALNRWPERTGIPLHDYLARWQQSCGELNAPGRLPMRLRALVTAP